MTECRALSFGSIAEYLATLPKTFTDKIERASKTGIPYTPTLKEYDSATPRQRDRMTWPDVVIDAIRSEIMTEFRPPAGTESGTYHWLKDIQRNESVVCKWTRNDYWQTFGSSSLHGLLASNYTYIAPCVAPEGI